MQNGNRKSTSLILAFAFIVSIISFGTTQAYAAEEITSKTEHVIPGDVNLDGVVDYKDAEALQKLLNNIEKMSKVQKENADVDRDGKITTSDVMLIQNCVTAAAADLQDSDDVEETGGGPTIIYECPTGPNKGQTPYYVTPNGKQPYIIKKIPTTPPTTKIATKTTTKATTKVTTKASTAKATTKATTAAPLNNLEQKVFELVNKERAAQGLKALVYRKDIQPAVDVRAKEIVKSFSHTRPNGKQFYTAVTDLGISYKSIGENIAEGYSTPQEVMKGWMNSPGHRANILNSGYTGMAVGVYQSGGRYYWVQIFIS